MALQKQNKLLLVISHLAMLLARTGFGLVIPLIIYLNSERAGDRKFKEEVFEVLKFQAKITFSFLGLQFLGFIYQLLVTFVSHPLLTQLNFSTYNPLIIINLASQVILTAGVVFAIFGAIFTGAGLNFRYPRFWFGKERATEP